MTEPVVSTDHLPAQVMILAGMEPNGDIAVIKITEAGALIIPLRKHKDGLHVIAPKEIRALFETFMVTMGGHMTSDCGVVVQIVEVE